MTRHQELVKNAKALVADNINAVDVESGLCRFCDRIVEAFDPEEIQGHRPSCPWQKVKELVAHA
jgi:hypothetical protein